MRIKILDIEMTIPNKLIEKVDKLGENEPIKQALENLIKNAEVIENKRNLENTKKATEIKKLKAREKVQNAINLLRLQGEEVNAYRVAKIANISYNTARKYLSK